MAAVEDGRVDERGEISSEISSAEITKIEEKVINAVRTIHFRNKRADVNSINIQMKDLEPD